MPKDAHVGPVPPEGYAEAVQFIASGGGSDALASAQAALLDDVLSKRGAGARLLWWARRARRCVAAAVVVLSPGRIGMLFSCPVEAPGVLAGELAEVVHGVSRGALDRGAAFVQSLTDPAVAQWAPVLAAAGFQRLAELIYMRLDLSAAAADEAPGLVWRSYGEFTEEELSRVIAASYGGSLDCPRLAGLRTMHDVIAAHKRSGKFTPESWWLVHLAGGGHSPAGCVLVNDVDVTTAELVYLGVVPACRGRGLGAAMVQGAAAQVRRRGTQAMTLAVDVENIYARRIYERLGFVETQRRLAHMLV